MYAFLLLLKIDIFKWGYRIISQTVHRGRARENLRIMVVRYSLYNAAHPVKVTVSFYADNRNVCEFILTPCVMLCIVEKGNCRRNVGTK